MSSVSIWGSPLWQFVGMFLGCAGWRLKETGGVNMHFKFDCVVGLPPLAWCAFFNTGDPAVRVVHGEGVEVDEAFFFEGAWAGAFEKQNVCEAFCAGSGGTILSGEVVFVTPSHTLEKLVVYQDGSGSYIISNSVAFALYFANDEFDPGFSYTQNLLHSFVHGPAVAAKGVPTASGAWLGLYYRANLSIRLDGTIDATEKGFDPTFATFDEYRGFLVRTVSRIFANASAPQRKRIYDPIATISGGYDSPASAALARDLGCKEALTFRRYSGEGQLIDHGGEIGAALGIDVYCVDRLAYLERDDCPEAEFFACGYRGEDMAMIGWERYLDRRLLVTGVHGDRVWDRKGGGTGTGLERSDAAGASLTEYRLRVGFIHLPLPFIGCTSIASIVSISRSEEMSPWSVGGDYDRPIPRRILEEKGLPRGAFGKQKRGSAVSFTLARKGRRGSLTGELTPQTAQEFRRFCAGQDVARYRRVQRIAGPLRRIRLRLSREGAGLFGRRAGATALRGLTKLVFGNEPEHVLNIAYSEKSLLPLWGVSKIQCRYKACDSVRDATGK